MSCICFKKRSKIKKTFKTLKTRGNKRAKSVSYTYDYSCVFIEPKNCSVPLQMGFLMLNSHHRHVGLLSRIGRCESDITVIKFYNKLSYGHDVNNCRACQPHHRILKSKLVIIPLSLFCFIIDSDSKIPEKNNISMLIRLTVIIITSLLTYKENRIGEIFKKSILVE